MRPSARNSREARPDTLTTTFLVLGSGPAIGRGIGASFCGATRTARIVGTSCHVVNIATVAVATPPCAAVSPPARSPRERTAAARHRHRRSSPRLPWPEFSADFNRRFGRPVPRRFGAGPRPISPRRRPRQHCAGRARWVQPRGYPPASALRGGPGGAVVRRGSSTRPPTPRTANRANITPTGTYERRVVARTGPPRLAVMRAEFRAPMA